MLELTTESVMPIKDRKRCRSEGEREAMRGGEVVEEGDVGGGGDVVEGDQADGDSGNKFSIVAGRRGRKKKCTSQSQPIRSSSLSNVNRFSVLSDPKAESEELCVYCHAGCELIKSIQCDVCTQFYHI